jgi:hypothetical protein
VLAGPTLHLVLAGFGWLALNYYAPALRALKGGYLSVVIDPHAPQHVQPSRESPL